MSKRTTLMSHEGRRKDAKQHERNDLGIHAVCDFVSFAVDELKTLPGDAQFDRPPRRQLAFRSDLHPTSFLLQPAERFRLRIRVSLWRYRKFCEFTRPVRGRAFSLPSFAYFSDPF